MLWGLVYGATLTGAFVVAWLFLALFVPAVMVLIRDIFAPLLDRREIEELMAREREYLGIPVDVRVELSSDPGDKSQAWHEEDGTFVVLIAHPIASTVRHEMYHVARMLCRWGGVSGSQLSYLFIEEPLALMYELFHVRPDFWNRRTA
ncbi:MAG TPA: hypothetical protein VD862_03165 [Candidatus Paceibacterota bacterium]|nr:hypothetical protein [Candidatus Paceibacterota bacterium]